MRYPASSVSLAKQMSADRFPRLLPARVEAARGRLKARLSQQVLGRDDVGSPSQVRARGAVADGVDHHIVAQSARGPLPGRRRQQSSCCAWRASLGHHGPRQCPLTRGRSSGPLGRTTTASRTLTAPGGTQPAARLCWSCRRSRRTPRLSELITQHMVTPPIPGGHLRLAGGAVASVC